MFFFSLWRGTDRLLKDFCQVKPKYLCCFRPQCHFFDVCLNETRRALKFWEDLSKNQPVNSHLRPFREFSDNSVPRQCTLSWSLKKMSRLPFIKCHKTESGPGCMPRTWCPFMSKLWCRTAGVKFTWPPATIVTVAMPVAINPPSRGLSTSPVYLPRQLASAGNIRMRKLGKLLLEFFFSSGRFGIKQNIAFCTCGCYPLPDENIFNRTSKLCHFILLLIIFVKLCIKKGVEILEWFILEIHT